MSLSRTLDDFHDAPFDWTPQVAEQLAQKEGVELQNDHWDEMDALQEFYARHEYDHIHVRELSDALDENQKNSKISNLLTNMRRRGKIVNASSKKKPRWQLAE